MTDVANPVPLYVVWAIVTAGLIVWVIVVLTRAPKRVPVPADESNGDDAPAKDA